MRVILVFLTTAVITAADVPLETEPSWVWGDEQWAYGVEDGGRTVSVRVPTDGKRKALFHLTYLS